MNGFPSCEGYLTTLCLSSGRCTLWTVLGALVGAIMLPRALHADDVAAAFYARSDSDHTTVISPRVRVSRSLSEDTRVDVAYTADVWTSASVDVRASASVRPVWEQRDELNTTFSHAWDPLRVSAGYRLSLEPDYTSHGVNLGVSVDLANKAARLDVSLRALTDVVGRAANPEFARGLGTYTGNVTFTQIIDTMMLAQLTYELTHMRGFQSSPYRFVGIGPSATGFGCRDASVCLPELVPHLRSRHAISLMVRRALGERVALGLHYRFYLDDWSLHSHTGLLELTLTLADRTLLSLRYRAYRQGSVDFYRKRYLDGAGNHYRGFRTRDRELSSLTYHRASLELEHELWSDDSAARLSGTLSLSGNRYHYAQFSGLDTVWALETSAALLLEL